MNDFYNRFDKHDFSMECNELRQLLNASSESSDSSLIVNESDVHHLLRSVNPSKAAGPDGMSPRLLKSCASQLSFIFTVIFNMSLKTCSIPSLWKKSYIIPVRKKPVISCMNDLRPVALTAVPMKLLERLFLNNFKKLVSSFLDPLQFAYQKGRSCKDAILSLLDKLYCHLEGAKRGNSVRLLFFDFSSAFNTIQPHTSVRKLIEMSLPSNYSLWILDYLTNRSQYVKLSTSDVHSDLVISNTGTPQGTVLAPFLFTVYTSDCRSSVDECPLVKFADGTATAGLISKDDDSAFISQVHSFVQYCEDNYLELNVTKTKEMVIDFRKNSVILEPLIIKDCVVERVSVYKYLGVMLNNELPWGDHVDQLIKKLNSRLY